MEALDGDADLENLLLDSTSVRAHRPASNARKKSGEQALGRSRGGLTRKLHLTADAPGDPVRLILTSGQAHDMSVAWPLIDGIEYDHVIADKGYDSGPFVATIEAAGATAVIPTRSNRREPREYDKHLSKISSIVLQRV